MRRTWVSCFTLISVIVLSGCPFQSSVPIGEPRPGSLDPKLMGQWSETLVDGGAMHVTVLPFNASEYYVELREKDPEPQRYRAYAVSVGGEQFLNLNEVKGDTPQGPFLFARYSISESGVLSLRLVGDDAVPKALGSDRKALIDFLAAHLGGTALDDSKGPLLMVREKPKKVRSEGGS